MINELAIYYWEEGDRKTAGELFFEALEALRASPYHGESHPDTMLCKNQLANYLAESNRKQDCEQAEDLYREALDYFQMERNDETARKRTVQIRDSLAVLIWENNGQHDEAGDMLTEALAEARNLLGDTHLTTLHVKRNFAMLKKRVGDLSGAHQLMEEVLAAQLHDPEMGKGDPETIKTVAYMAEIKLKAGDMYDAQLLFIEALGSRRRALGDDHPDTLDSMRRLGSLRHKQCDYADAATYYNEALDKLANSPNFGANHPKTIETKHELAVVLSKTDAISDLKRAEKLHTETLRFRRKRKGLNHRDTVKSVRHLVEVKMKRGDLEGATLLVNEELHRPDAQRDVRDSLWFVKHLRKFREESGDMKGFEALLRQEQSLQEDVWKLDDYRDMSDDDMSDVN